MTHPDNTTIITFFFLIFGIKHQDRAIILLIINTENNNTNENFIYLALQSTLPTLQDQQLQYRADDLL